jgi:hypothetical protein
MPSNTQLFNQFESAGGAGAGGISRSATNGEEDNFCGRSVAGHSLLVGLPSSSSSLARDFPFLCFEEGCDFAAATNPLLKAHFKSKHNNGKIVVTPQVLREKSAGGKRARATSTLTSDDDDECKEEEVLDDHHSIKLSTTMGTVGAALAISSSSRSSVPSLGRGRRLTYVCEIKGCDYEADRRSILTTHLLVIHNLRRRTEEEEDKEDREKEERGRATVAEAQITTTTTASTKLVAPPSSLALRPHQYICKAAGCGYTTVVNSHFARHQETHTGVRPYLCTVKDCAFTTAFAQSLTVHMRKRHNGRGKKMVAVVAVPVVVPVAVAVPVVVAPVITVAAAPVVDVVVAPVIKKRPMLATYSCKEDGCSFTSTRMRKLPSHMMIHTGEKPFLCIEVGCTFAARRKDYISRHMKAEHKKDSLEYKKVSGNFPGAAGSAFTSASAADGGGGGGGGSGGSGWTLSSGTAIRHACQVEGCDHSYSKPSNLIRHMLIHSSEKKLLKCVEEGCMYESFFVDAMRGHTKNMHPILRYQVCEHEGCDYATAVSGALKIHFKSMHVDKFESLDMSVYNHHKLTKDVKGVHGDSTIVKERLSSMSSLCVEEEVCDEFFDTSGAGAGAGAGAMR